MKRPHSSDLSRTADHWDRYVELFHNNQSGCFWWEAGPELQAEINRRVTGDRSVDWIEFTLQTFFADKLPLRRCLSLGCGTGHMERRLAKLGAFTSCDACDISVESLLAARGASQLERIDNIHYFAVDANRLSLPQGIYDAVWIHSALHHFESLESILGEIRRSLRPGGLLVLNEYVGPSRFSFPSRQRELSDLCLNLLPAQYRVMAYESAALDLQRNPLRNGPAWFMRRIVDKFRDGDLLSALGRRLVAYRIAASRNPHIKKEVVFPSPRDVYASDPSEAVRSQEIFDLIGNEFEIVTRKDWGGNILQFLLAGIAGNFAASDTNSAALINMLVNIEDTLIQCGELSSDFAYVVARPKEMA